MSRRHPKKAAAIEGRSGRIDSFRRTNRECRDMMNIRPELLIVRFLDEDVP